MRRRQTGPAARRRILLAVSFATVYSSFTSAIHWNLNTAPDTRSLQCHNAPARYARFTVPGVLCRCSAGTYPSKPTMTGKGSGLLTSG